MARYAHLPEKEAMKEVARERGLSRREIYQQWKITRTEDSEEDPSLEE